jgi:hypothetical protein
MQKPATAVIAMVGLTMVAGTTATAHTQYGTPYNYN